MTTTPPTQPSNPAKPAGGPASLPPLSPHVVPEADVWIAIDHLRIALETVRLAMEVAKAVPLHLPDDAPAADIHIRWNASLELLGDAFERVDYHGLAAIEAIRAMLAR